MTESPLSSIARLRKARENNQSATGVHTPIPVHTIPTHKATSFLADSSTSIFADDDELDSPLLDFDAEVEGGDDLGVFAVGADAPTTRHQKTKEPKADTVEDWDFTKNDKLMLNVNYSLGWIPGAQLALACGKKYETKKGRIAFLESKGYLTSVVRMGYKFYYPGPEGLIRIGKKVKEEKFPEMGKWRHNFMLATQVITIGQQFADREPTEKEESLPATPFWGTGKRILKSPFANNPLPVITEKTMFQHVALAEELLSSGKKYGEDYNLRSDLYRKEWRKNCQDILDDPDYPTTVLNPAAVGTLTPETHKKLTTYWTKAQGGYAAAAFLHWDDEFTFGGKAGKKAGKESHKRRADAIIPLPHIRNSDGTVSAASIAVEVELTRKSVDEYCDIIAQWYDHPLIGGLVYITDDSTIASTLRAARQKLITTNRISEEQFGHFLFAMRRAVYINGHLDDEGYLG